MESYLSGSEQKVWWVCESNICGCHIWLATINKRTCKNPTGCPYCAKNPIPCIHNNLQVQFLDLISEWDPNNKKLMSEYTHKSNVVVSWICKISPCACHKWKISICNRTKNNKPTGCPFCSKFTERVCEHNNLEILFPELKREWHPDNLKTMKEYSYGSNVKVWWVCCKITCSCHMWETQISKRIKTKDPTGCPFCTVGRICEHNNLEINFPELKIEWHPDNTRFMKEFGSGSIAKVKWLCSKNSSHVWDTVIYARTRRSKDKGTNCPFCCKSKGYSDAEINWITEIEQNENIIIKNALSSERQFKIPGVGKVDGYC